MQSGQQLYYVAEGGCLVSCHCQYNYSRGLSGARASRYAVLVNILSHIAMQICHVLFAGNIASGSMALSR